MFEENQISEEKNLSTILTISLWASNRGSQTRYH
jgi:hypothetical protein